MQNFKSSFILKIKLDKHHHGRSYKSFISSLNQPIFSILDLLMICGKLKNNDFHSKSEEIIMFLVLEISVNGKDYKMNNWDFVNIAKSLISTDLMAALPFEYKITCINDKITYSIIN